MQMLAFDTCLDKTYVSLLTEKSFITSEIIENHNEKYHSAFLIPTIVKILKENNLTMQDIDVIGTNVGPGSFTGIRACVTVARVIAQQLNCLTIGVNSLEILSKINKSASKTIVILDARKNQYYTAVYENGIEIKQPELTNADDVLKMSLSESTIISDESTHKFLAENGYNSEIYTAYNDNLGLYLGQIVRECVLNNENSDYSWARLKPLYLQAPPVSMPKKI
jgi:tRNA threonylcarbamoyl adenosine modification protein YeaZ